MHSCSATSVSRSSSLWRAKAACAATFRGQVSASRATARRRTGPRRGRRATHQDVAKGTPSVLVVLGYHGAPPRRRARTAVRPSSAFRVASRGTRVACVERENGLQTPPMKLGATGVVETGAGIVLVSEAGCVASRRTPSIRPPAFLHPPCWHRRCVACAAAAALDELHLPRLRALLEARPVESGEWLPSTRPRSWTRTAAAPRGLRGWRGWAAR